MTTALLAVRHLSAGYDAVEIVRDLSLSLQEGEVLSLVGRNGVGKTTALRAIAGQLAMTTGERWLADADATRFESFRLSRAGLAYVPADRMVFAELTVRENLMLGAYVHGSGPWTIPVVADELFPRLGERLASLAGSLSGGEQQMLVIARALLSNPKVLLLDEPTEGLAPVVVDAFVAVLRRIRDSGLAMILVEQNLQVPKLVATRHAVMDNGSLVWEGDAERLSLDAKLVESLLTA